eukprot:172056-Chlamydomonas_euryale.AAC.1
MQESKGSNVRRTLGRRERLTGSTNVRWKFGIKESSRGERVWDGEEREQSGTKGWGRGEERGTCL